MKLTKAKAKAITIELWEWLAEDGTRRKCSWPKWKEDGKIWASCPLCEQAKKVNELPRCKVCMYYAKFGPCFVDTPFYHWDISDDPEDRVKYANEFLVQLRSL